MIIAHEPSNDRFISMVREVPVEKKIFRIDLETLQKKRSGAYAKDFVKNFFRKAYQKFD
jgi:hypothetical protein